MPTISVYLTDESFMFLAQRSSPGSTAALGKEIIEEWIKEHRNDT